ncbi:MAG: hypothetical protein QOD99_1999 [Chthoniobacter sp.]|jgi:integrase|nr:hypothetical protein [Chthoniobacter sp.]
MKTNEPARARKRLRARNSDHVWVRHHPSLGEKYQWVVAWRDSQGKRCKKFYASKREAETAAEIKGTELTNKGVQAQSAYADERFRVMAWEAAEKLRQAEPDLRLGQLVDWFIGWRNDLTPHRKKVADAVDHYIKHLGNNARSITINELIAHFRRSKERKGVGELHLRDISKRLERFASIFGDVLANEVTAAEIEDWLHGLGLGGQSTNNFRVHLHGLFNFGMKRDYLGINPVTRVDRVKVIRKPPEVFAPEEVARLLTTAWERGDGELLAYLCLGGFAGLRTAEMFDLDWRAIDWQQGFINVNAQAAKTAKRRLVKILPPLEAWLQPFAKLSGTFAITNFQKRHREFFKAAGFVRWKVNGLRHSYATYHLAKWQNAAALAKEMGNSVGVIREHYRNLAAPKDADRYWDIQPSRDAEQIVALAAG